MNKWNRKWIWGIAVVLTVAGLAIWRWPANLPEKQNLPLPAKPPHHMVVSMDAMEQEFHDNKIAAREKYSQASLTVTGKLLFIDNSGSCFYLVSSAEMPTIRLRCVLDKKDDAQKDYLRRLNTGQTITVEGTLGDITIVQGYVFDMQVKYFP